MWLLGKGRRNVDTASDSRSQCRTRWEFIATGTKSQSRTIKGSIGTNSDAGRRKENHCESCPGAPLYTRKNIGNPVRGPLASKNLLK